MHPWKKKKEKEKSKKVKRRTRGEDEKIGHNLKPPDHYPSEESIRHFVIIVEPPKSWLSKSATLSSPKHVFRVVHTRKVKEIGECELAF